jgi:hypothetical protein
MLASLRVQARIGQPQPLDRLPAKNMRLDNLRDIRLGDVSIPNRIRINDHIRSVLALVEAARLIRPHAPLQPVLSQFLLEKLLQFAFGLRIATSPRMAHRTLVSADKNVFLEFWYQATARLGIDS